MTRDEFIDKCLEFRRSDIPGLLRTEDGVACGEYIRHAIPCHCDYEGCQGWSMVGEDWDEWKEFKEAKEKEHAV